MHRSLPTLRVLFIAGLLTLSGCHRKKPSPDFSQASARFTQLYVQKLDDAYADPQMDAVLAQLRSVPDDSLDAPAAQQLIARIEDGQHRAKEEAEKRAKAAALANTPVKDFAFREERAEHVEAAKDAGAAEAAHPTAGMSVEELNKRFSDCFQQGGPIMVNGQGMRDTYVLKDYLFCRERHPGFDQQFVVADGVKVLGIYAKSAAVRTYEDGGTAQ